MYVRTYYVCVCAYCMCVIVCVCTYIDVQIYMYVCIDIYMDTYIPATALLRHLVEFLPLLKFEARKDVTLLFRTLLQTVPQPATLPLAQVCACMHLCVRMHACRHACVCGYGCMSVCIHVCACVCLSVDACTYLGRHVGMNVNTCRPPHARARTHTRTT